MKNKKSKKNRIYNIVLPLYIEGCCINIIHNITNINRDDIVFALEDHGIHESNYDSNEILTIKKLNSFSNDINIGDRFNIMASRDKYLDDIPGIYNREITVEILKKFPKFVVTDKGDFIYFDLFKGKKL